MEITVTGRHVQISDRFRQILGDKLTKVEQYAPRTQRVDVVVSHETSKGAPKGSERVEITCIAKGPVIRAEAFSDDKYTAMDLALQKLAERLRRAGDRRKVRRRGRGVEEPQVDLEMAAAVLAPAEVPSEAPEPRTELEEKLGAQGDLPVQVREKVHEAAPMTLDQALYEMELVGHDFYLFIDRDSTRPSVVYRRRGWDYGVISLELPTSAA